MSAGSREIGQVPPSGIHALGAEMPEDVAGLFDAVFGPGSGAAHQARYAWQYPGGGAGVGARLEVLFHQGRAVASLGSLPAPLFLAGKPEVAHFTADLAAHPHYRSRGLGARLLQRFVAAPGIALAFGVSPDARALLTRMGFEEVPLNMHFCVLSLSGLARRRAAIPLRDGRLGPPTLKLLEAADRFRPAWAGVLEALAGPWSRAREAGAAPSSWAREAPHNLLTSAYTSVLRQRTRHQIRVQWSSSLPEGLDHDLSPLLESWPVALSPSRDGLQRRFLEHPTHTYHLALAHRGNAFCGYAIWRSFVEPDGLIMAHLSALMCARADADTLDALIGAGLTRLRALGVFAVKAVSGDEHLQAALARHLFFPYGESPGLHFFCVSPDTVHMLRQPWSIGLGSSDVDL